MHLADVNSSSAASFCPAAVAPLQFGIRLYTGLIQEMSSHYVTYNTANKLDKFTKFNIKDIE